ncbi:hypothetical protein Pyn_05430 [Prunus yedoensis var. nudiflora]|uniref:Uncharacterized protein n=1 Tax=Prunus yedoensis var. nudiflora TaxID=2094558 RepID=A0A314Y4Z0_PRUYE|nr:hypothetical protein Pyn_05430 [Prunus yedoensis var. nudiflora]
MVGLRVCYGRDSWSDLGKSPPDFRMEVAAGVLFEWGRVTAEYCNMELKGGWSDLCWARLRPG